MISSFIQNSFVAGVIILDLYGPSTDFKSFRERSVTRATLFLGDQMRSNRI